MVWCGRWFGVRWVSGIWCGRVKSTRVRRLRLENYLFFGYQGIIIFLQVRGYAVSGVASTPGSKRKIGITLTK